MGGSLTSQHLARGAGRCCLPSSPMAARRGGGDSLSGQGQVALVETFRRAGGTGRHGVEPSAVPPARYCVGNGEGGNDRCRLSPTKLAILASRLAVLFRQRAAGSWQAVGRTLGRGHVLLGFRHLWSAWRTKLDRGGAARLSPSRPPGM